MRGLLGREGPIGAQEGGAPKKGPIWVQEGGAQKGQSKDRCSKKGSQETKGGSQVESQREGIPSGTTKPGGHQNFQFGYLKCPSDFEHGGHRTCPVLELRVLNVSEINREIR